MTAISAAPPIDPAELRRMTARQVAAKLRGGFRVRYWTVVQHQRDARTANAPGNIFVVDHDAHMKKKRPGALEDGAGPFRSGVEILEVRVVFYRRTAPGESPPLVEGPVPLSEVGPPAVPLGPPCANADMPDSANAVANAIVVNFMAVSFRW
jgi:hypothetical protein